jgi:hypothetical protein
LKRGSGPRSGSAGPPSHRYCSKVRYRTATDYGLGICIWVRIRTVRYASAFEFCIGASKIKLLGVRIRVQYLDPDLPGLVRIIRHRIRMTCDAHDGGDSPRKTTAGPKSGLKIKICLKSKFFPPQVHSRIRGLGSGPKSGSGLIRWHQARERILGSSLDPTQTALPLIRTGIQHMLGPVRISCLWPTMEKKMAKTG